MLVIGPWNRDIQIHVYIFLIFPQKHVVKDTTAADNILGVVVQSIISLMSLLMTISLAVVSYIFSGSLIFFQQKCE